MAWTVVFLDARVEDAMLGQPAGIRAGSITSSS